MPKHHHDWMMTVQIRLCVLEMMVLRHQHQLVHLFLVCLLLTFPTAAALVPVPPFADSEKLLFVGILQCYRPYPSHLAVLDHPASLPVPDVPVPTFYLYDVRQSWRLYGLSPHQWLLQLILRQGQVRKFRLRIQSSLRS